jgi:hypothetical protein
MPAKKLKTKQPNLDDNRSAKIEFSQDETGKKKKIFNAPVKLYGTALYQDRWIACGVILDVFGNVEDIRQYYHSEVDVEFAADHLRRVLVDERKITL